MKRLRSAVEVFKALGHPVRLRILAMLRGGELCVCRMTAVLDLAASELDSRRLGIRRLGDG